MGLVYQLCFVVSFLFFAVSKAFALIFHVHNFIDLQFLSATLHKRDYPNDTKVIF